MKEPLARRLPSIDPCSPFFCRVPTWQSLVPVSPYVPKYLETLARIGAQVVIETAE
jgi:hypothetical protein